MKVRNILVPVDYSESGDAAIDYAVSLAREYDAELHLVHVYLPPYTNIDAGFTGYTLPSDLPPVDINAEEARLERIKPAEDVKFRHEFIVGSPNDELVNYAKEQEIKWVCSIFSLS